MRSTFIPASHDATAAIHLQMKDAAVPGCSQCPWISLIHRGMPPKAEAGGARAGVGLPGAPHRGEASWKQRSWCLHAGQAKGRHLGDPAEIDEDGDAAYPMAFVDDV